MMFFLKKWKWPALIFVLIALAIGAYLYSLVFSSNTSFDEKSKVIFIYQNDRVSEWLYSLGASGVLEDLTSFERVANMKNFREVKPGRYRIMKGMGNNAIINMLRSGNQEAISIRIDDTHSIYELAGKMGNKLKTDSTAFIKTFTDEELCASYGFNSSTIACMVSPNTYEFFWTMTPAEFLERMQAIWKDYWTNEKLALAKSKNLTQSEVCILASIVKAECRKTDEAPKIAGLYLNRLRIDMPLQADPTAVFGSGLRGVSRVYAGITEIDSPFNTYRNKGLPPGPIDFSESIYLDAVLMPENHSYIYMCAQPGRTGYHNFAKSYNQHLDYKRAYTEWLDKNDIR